MSNKRKGLSLIQIKEAIPGYLWYSGILVQFAVVLIGLQTIASFFEWRPTHRLAKAITENLKAEKYCTSLFRGQEFAWLDPKPFATETTTARGAELVRLTYRNLGSVGISPEGYHLYRVAFEAQIRDTDSGDVVMFPPLAEELMQVNKDNRVVGCMVDMPNRTTSDAKVQEVSYKACETAGWSRRYLCDRGTDRCYPVAQCEKRAAQGGT